ncbi:MAG: ABC transporter permease [Anaerolineae bacterium]|nr:ABC transporter permease [Anaerolineae bacterium]
MRNFWLMARYEYLKRVRTRSFLLTTLGVPALIVVIGLVGAITALSERNNSPVGYVDHAGFLNEALYADPYLEDMEDRIALIPYAEEEAARAALEAGEIQGYYVLPAGYPQNPQIDSYYMGEAPAGSDFADFVRANLVAQANIAPATQAWLVEGPEVTVRDLNTGRELGRDAFAGVVLPLVGGFFFFFAVMGSSGFLLQIVGDEKENRTMEILITSVNPLQLIGGKALGLIAVALTQITLWALAVAVTVIVASRFVELPGALTMPWSFVAVMVLYFLPSYALIAGMMTVIGSATTELQQGQQIAGILNLLFIAPFFFLVLIFSNPNSPLLVFLTLFPTTSFMTVAMRWGVTGVPTWQLVTSWTLLVATAAATIWLAARVFRLGMLRYGQRVAMREVVAALRGMEA